MRLCRVEPSRGSTRQNGARRTPRSVMIAVTYLAGVTSKAGFSMPSAVGGHLDTIGMSDFLRGAALFDRDAFAGRGFEVDRVGTERQRRRDAVFLRQNADAVGTPILLAVSPLAAMRSAPTTTAWMRPLDIRCADMLSHRTVVGMLSFISSHAVRRAPCKNGRVSSARTSILSPSFDGSANDTEGGAVAAGGERPSVAVGEDGAFAFGMPAVPRRMRQACGSWRCPRRRVVARGRRRLA